MKKSKIYGLKDPRTGLVNYIGKTSRLYIADRLKVHIYQSKVSKIGSQKELWIKELLRNNLKPTIILLEEVNEVNWEEAEIKWIKYGTENKWPLKNATLGGRSTKTIIPKTYPVGYIERLKNRMKANQYGKGIKWTDSQMALMMQSRKNPWNKGLKNVQSHDEEWKKKASERMRGDKHPMLKLKDSVVLEIRIRHKNGEKIKNLSKEFKISNSHLNKIVNNKIRKNICPVL